MGLFPGVKGITQETNDPGSELGPHTQIVESETTEKCTRGPASTLAPPPREQKDTQDCLILAHTQTTSQEAH